MARTTDRERQPRIEVSEKEGEYHFLQLQVKAMEKELERKKKTHDRLQEKAHVEDAKVEELTQLSTRNRNASTLCALEKDMLADQVRKLHLRSQQMRDVKFVEDRKAYDQYIHSIRHAKVVEYRERVDLAYQKMLK